MPEFPTVLRTDAGRIGVSAFLPSTITLPKTKGETRGHELLLHVHADSWKDRHE